MKWSPWERYMLQVEANDGVILAVTSVPRRDCRPAVRARLVSYGLVSASGGLTAAGIHEVIEIRNKTMVKR